MWYQIHKADYCLKHFKLVLSKAARYDIFTINISV